MSLNELWSGIPPITRTLILGSATLALLVSLDLVTPYKLYFNWPLIRDKGQYWRMLTCLLYHGELSPQTIFDFTVFYYYSSKLELGDFRHSPGNLIVFLVFTCSLFLIAASYFGLQFLNQCLSASMLYLWARRNPNVDVSLMEIFVIKAQFLPLFITLLVTVFGFSVVDDLIGYAVGHLYYFLADVLPNIPETKGLEPLESPLWLDILCDFFEISDAVNELALREE